MRRLAHHAAHPERGRKIVQRQNRVYAGKRARGRRIDVFNHRMCVLAAQEGNVQKSGKPDVVDEAAATHEQRRVFQTPEARTDPAVGDLAGLGTQLVIAWAAFATTSFGVA